MAGSKKKVKQINEPKGNSIGQGGDPDQYYSQYPAWNFHYCDSNMWTLYGSEVRQIFWNRILPKLQGWETQTWAEILIDAKKQNHSIDVNNLNKKAQERLLELHIEAESLISLRLTGSHRIYGYINGVVFNILWVDLNHGDNDICVCKSIKKHT